MDNSSADYERSPVPEGEGSGGLHIALIIIGGTIGFSIFVVASQIGGSLGYEKGGAAFALGCLILGLMGATTSYIGAKSRLSTYLLTEFAFGNVGAKVVNFAIALSLVGWYAVISNVLGATTHTMLIDSFGINVPTNAIIVVASFLMIWVTIKGFSGIDRLALMFVPVMVAFILYAAYAARQSGIQGEPADIGFTFQTAVSAVIGTYIAGVIIQPDYSRFAKRVSHAVWAVFIALGVVFPLILFFSAVPGMVTGNPDMIQVMLLLGILLPAFFLLFLGAWSSNVLCLYSSSLSFATMATKVKLSIIIATIGFFGTVLAFLPVQEYLIDFLVLLGIAIPPIGAIYVIDTMILRRFVMDIDGLDAEPPIRWEAFAAWAIAIAVGYASANGIVGLFFIGSLDSLVASAAVFLILNAAARACTRHSVIDSLRP
ncbi:MAG: cytosine permease [Erythrobacter sp.]